MKAVRADRILRLAMLFHDLGKPDTLERDHEGEDSVEESGEWESPDDGH